MTRLRDVRPTTWLTAGVLLLLPVLAVMQHLWLERIGDDVGTRMRVVAENAARALARDLDFELLRAWRPWHRLCALTMVAGVLLHVGVATFFGYAWDFGT